MGAVGDEFDNGDSDPLVRWVVLAPICAFAGLVPEAGMVEADTTIVEGRAWPLFPGRTSPNARVTAGPSVKDVPRCGCIGNREG